MKKQILFLLLLAVFETTSAFGNIVYVDHNDQVYQHVAGGNLTFTFDLNGDGQNDVELNMLSFGGGTCGYTCTQFKAISFNDVFNVYGQSKVNSTTTTISGTPNPAIDCTDSTLNSMSTWTVVSFLAKGCDLNNAPNICWFIGFGTHKQGVQMITACGYKYAYIDYSYTGGGDIVIHGWYYEDTCNVGIVANSLLDYPYDGGCIVYDSVTVYDTITTQIYDTTYVTVYDSISVTDTLFIDVQTLGNPSSLLGTVKIYPNPANEILFVYIQLYSNFNGYKIRIENSAGQLIEENQIVGFTQQYDLSEWDGAGLYYVKVISDTGTTVETKKIILQ